MGMRIAKTQISLGIHPSESLLYVQWVAKNSNFLYADREDSDENELMHRLLGVGTRCDIQLLCWFTRVSSRVWV